MLPIIGLDFGDHNSFACFISDFGIGTRMGGTVYDLLRTRLGEGIPSVFFYSKRVGETLLCENAVKPRAFPLHNRLSCLRRHLGEIVQLDDRTIYYDQAITDVIQHCIRSANKKLQDGWQMTTNLVSLSYPASYTFAQKQRLIELAEKATLEDGTRVKVYGTIAEPAAAALDYLAEFAKSNKDTTVLTYDLGSRDFELGLVSVYPKGRKNRDGYLYFYDTIDSRGIPGLGGADFDEVMFQLLYNKVRVPFPLNSNNMILLRDIAENTKVELSESTEEMPMLYVGDDFIDIPVSRREFEEASKGLLQKTIDATKRILDEHPNQKPEIILLTGGASQMPMVKRELEEALPQYKDKTIIFSSNSAIAYGAARYGAF